MSEASQVFDTNCRKRIEEHNELFEEDEREEKWKLNNRLERR